MIKPNQFLFRKKYEKWLKENNVSESSINSYCLLTRYPDTDFTFFDIVGAFAYRRETLYALAAYEKWKHLIDTSNFSPKTRSNNNFYIAKYRLFLEELLSLQSIPLSADDKVRQGMITQRLSSIKKGLEYSISTESSGDASIQIDGMDILISNIGEERFVRLAIESSYFFSKELCKKRFDEIADVWKTGKDDPVFVSLEQKCLPARYSSKVDNDKTDGVQEQRTDPREAVFRLKSSKKECRIYQDGYRGNDKSYYGGGNGNTRVCQLIKYFTGYDLGTVTEKKSFKNFIISHIWGRAVDPRYFTNFWNIAIVPAWANHLLDKDESGTLSATFKATIKQVMTDYYELGSYDWKKIDMDNCPENKESNLILSRRPYTVNIINEKKKGEAFGSISKMTL